MLCEKGHNTYAKKVSIGQPPIQSIRQISIMHQGDLYNPFCQSMSQSLHSHVHNAAVANKELIYISLGECNTILCAYPMYSIALTYQYRSAR